MIAEIETDKATMDFQAYEDGTLLKILVGDGESAALGAPIAIVGAEGEEVTVDAHAATARPPSGRRRRSRAADAPTTAVPPPAAERRPPAAGRAPATARRRCGRARSRAGWPTPPGFDLRTLAGTGTGPDGRIVKADVERALRRRPRRRRRHPRRRAAPRAARCRRGRRARATRCAS